MTPAEHGLKTTILELELNEKIVQTKESKINELMREMAVHRADVGVAQAVIAKCRKRLSKHTGE